MQVGEQVFIDASREISPKAGFHAAKPECGGVEGCRLDWPQLHFQGQGTLLKA